MKEHRSQKRWFARIAELGGYEPIYSPNMLKNLCVQVEYRDDRITFGNQQGHREAKRPK